ncbi:hypothetical protein [Ferrovibrio sp.]|uniref:hypothetical protein n=1 Tax=Ferrovibrio sp. TaxID=1917215 RepID=UPI003D0AB576
MAVGVERIRVTGRTETTIDVEINAGGSEVVTLRLDGMSGAALIAAIMGHAPAMPAPNILDLPCYGFATSPSAEGQIALAFQVTPNRYPLAIRVPHEKLAEIRAAIAKWETLQQGGRA